MTQNTNNKSNENIFILKTTFSLSACLYLTCIYRTEDDYIEFLFANKMKNKNSGYLEMEDKLFKSRWNGLTLALRGRENKHVQMKWTAKI